VGLFDVAISDASLLACKEQLVGLRPVSFPHVLSKLTQLRALDLTWCTPEAATQLLQQAPELNSLTLQLIGTAYSWLSPAWSSPCVLQHYGGLTGLQELTLAVQGPKAAPMEMCSLARLRRLALDFSGVHMLCVGSWAHAVAGLVNLEVLSMPAVLTACYHPWLTVLTRLVVLEVTRAAGTSIYACPFDVGVAAHHIARLLMANTCSPAGFTAPPTNSSSSSSAGNNPGTTSSSNVGGSGSSIAAGGCMPSAGVLLVCFGDSASHPATAAGKLYRAVAAAAPVLPPGVHLFRGSLSKLRVNGVELWPAPVAARLQQLW
jgi:hypothetical protein